MKDKKEKGMIRLGVNNFKKILCVILALITVGLMSGCSSGVQSVTTDGSTSMSKVIGALGEQFMKDNNGIKVTYNPTGSASGISAVLEGRCDLGLSSRNLKAQEIENGLEETIIALDAIAVIVHPDNPVNDLDIETIAKIFTGEIGNWKDIGGNEGEIVLVGREAGSGTRDGFETITNTAEKCIYRQELTSTGDVITSVAGNPNAIGYASLASVKSTVKTISVGGVVPNEVSVKDGSYKIQRPFVVVRVKNKKLSDGAQAFFDYITSDKANEIISAAGAVPVN